MWESCAWAVSRDVRENGVRLKCSLALVRCKGPCEHRFAQADASGAREQVESLQQALAEATRVQLEQEDELRRLQVRLEMCQREADESEGARLKMQIMEQESRRICVLVFLLSLC